MRTIAVILLSASMLSSPAQAIAAGGGPVGPRTVGPANPAPPAAGAEVGAPAEGKSLVETPLGTGADDTAKSTPAPPGIDTSTAAPGGQAESSRNGALSTPPDITKPAKHHKKGNAAGS
jgi:hypothetical protein